MYFCFAEAIYMLSFSKIHLTFYIKILKLFVQMNIEAKKVHQTSVKSFFLIEKHLFKAYRRRFFQFEQEILGNVYNYQKTVLRRPMTKINACDQSYEVGSCSDESNWQLQHYFLRGKNRVIQDRIRLIQMVCLEKQQIVPTASSLGIKTSTAKYILKCFKKDGKILLKNFSLIEQEEKSLYEKIKILKKKVEQACKNKNQRPTKTNRAFKPTTSSLEQVGSSPVAQSLQNSVQRVFMDAGKTSTQQEQPEAVPNIDLSYSSMVYFFVYNAPPIQNAINMWY